MRQTFPKSQGNENSPDESFSDYGENILKGNLITEQHKDRDSSCLFERTVDENEVSFVTLLRMGS